MSLENWLSAHKCLSLKCSVLSFHLLSIYCLRLALPPLKFDFSASKQPPQIATQSEKDVSSLSEFSVTPEEKPSLGSSLVLPNTPFTDRARMKIQGSSPRMSQRQSSEYLYPGREQLSDTEF